MFSTTVLTLGVLASAMDTWAFRGGLQDIAYDVIGAVAVLIMVIGAVRRPRGSRWAWLIVAAGFGCWTVGDGISTWYEEILHKDAPYPGVPDVLYLLGYPVLVAGIVWLTRKSGPALRAHSFGDAVIVSLGVGVVTWQTLIDRAFDDPSLGLSGRFLTVAYPAMDLALLLLIVRALFAGALRNSAGAYLAAGVGLTLVADVASAAGWTAGLYFLWLGGYVLAATAVLQPGQASTRPAPVDMGHRTRFYLLGLSACASPILLIASEVTHRHVDVVMLAAVSIITVSLVVGRLAAFVRRLSEANAAHLDLTRQLQHRANHDDLTGVVNRSVFVDHVNRAISDQQRRTATLAFIDLDGFKAINDGAGHHIGDEILVAVTSRLRDVLRNEDLIGRLGGDEFAVLAAGISTNEIGAFGGRIVAAFDQPFATSRGSLHIHASVGIAQAALGEDGDTVLANADAAMYAAKRQGKNRFALFDGDFRSEVLDRLRVQQLLEDAIRADRLEVHYQPVVAAIDGTWLGLEALVRCPDTDGSLVAPGAFLPIAEDAGLMESIDRAVLTRAITDINRWRQLAGSEHLQVSVNKSARTLLAPDHETYLLDLLVTYGVPPEALIIELTEDVHVSDPDGVSAVLQRHRRRGIQIALDDFGTGYSALSYLNKLPLDILKVPMHFTTMLNGERRPAGLAEAVFALGQTMGLCTVAEGVETPEQWAALKGVGCERAQGYHFARPMPASEIEKILVAHASRRESNLEAAT